MVPASVRERVARGRVNRARARVVAVAVLALIAASLFAVALMVGQTFYGASEVLRVVLGQTVPGASFTVGELRLPRSVLAVLAGAAFALAGVTFQTMLRNPLASPDIIGISSGASAAAVFGIVTFGLSGATLSIVAIVAALATALLIYGLSYSGGVAGTRLILIGIGISSMLHSVVSYQLIKAATWDLQTAMRWLTGSVNDATWQVVAPLAVALAVLAPVLFGQARNLTLLQLGDDTAAALGVSVERTRLLAIVAAVALVAFATAAAGPIAFVAFLSGPIAARIVRPGGSLMLPAAFVGALLVLGADLLGQFAFDARYPVGVITGALGAPYLVYLLVRTNRSGGSL
ncbi:iron complex transport system permease protein [Kineosphaera limosa]|uniref:Putative iron-siderophore ABC transporter permease protein n=1 Tax=Kineosphaera limosa NBRC 100340 TaxID=1184609 RepID=K6WM91_9MICO|nr:iron chelate uptake ABC transporter family permease subunit [Kineosphaera limosa]NYE00903.1 iron complex transport system permease protein [Kineosphaera limosa]GAB94901.1 putative iron-siderophore ABC transporter permease protein [Kineosphaera limosa NBRC 100340]